jgi:ubiquinone/menaquinone biosynthesis C-methylase UbiE
MDREVGTRGSALGDVERIYRAWGRHPHLYAAQDLLTFLGRHRTIRRAAARALHVTRGARVLEVACGTGRNFPYVQEQIGADGRLVGLDYSHEMLGAARSLVADRRWRNVCLLAGDAAELDVGSGHFDAVLCVLGMSAMPRHVAALRRCRDVLRPGGYLSVCDAQLFSGRLSKLNPLVRDLYVPTTGWDPHRDLVRDVEQVFGSVQVERFNAGSFFVASAQKREVESDRVQQGVMPQTLDSTIPPDGQQ